MGDPERPKVVRDRRLRWAWAAALVIGPGYCCVGCCELLFPFMLVSLLLRETEPRWPPKRLAKVSPANEDRRPRPGGGEGDLSSAISIRMLVSVFVDRCVWERILLRDDQEGCVE